jgi:sec-independent protein translocase protein TatB
MDFLGMGWLEILVIAIVALLVVGPEKLPGYARKVGRFVRQFRKITSNLSQEVSKALELDEEDEDKKIGTNLQQDFNDIKASLEKDAAELKKSLETEAQNARETIASTTKEASESLKKETSEISQTLAAEGQELKNTIASEAQTAARNLGMDVPEVKTTPEPQPAAAVPSDPDGQT